MRAGTPEDTDATYVPVACNITCGPVADSAPPCVASSENPVPAFTVSVPDTGTVAPTAFPPTSAMLMSVCRPPPPLAATNAFAAVLHVGTSPLP